MRPLPPISGHCRVPVHRSICRLASSVCTICTTWRVSIIIIIIVQHVTITLWRTTINKITSFAKNIGSVNVGSVACRLTGCRLRGIGLVTVGSLNVGSVTGTQGGFTPGLLVVWLWLHWCRSYSGSSEHRFDGYAYCDGCGKLWFPL